MSNLFNTEIEGRQFNFQPIGLGDDHGYHVDVKDVEGTRWEFTLIRKNSQWLIEAEKLPDWIEASRAKLIETVDRYS